MSLTVSSRYPIWFHLVDLISPIGISGVVVRVWTTPDTSSGAGDSSGGAGYSSGAAGDISSGAGDITSVTVAPVLVVPTSPLSLWPLWHRGHRCTLSLCRCSLSHAVASSPPTPVYLSVVTSFSALLAVYKYSFSTGVQLVSHYCTNK